MELSYRIATSEDAPFIAGIFNATWPGTAPSVPTDEQNTFIEAHSVESWIERISEELYCIVEDRDEPRFFVLLQEKEDYVLLDRIFLLPEVQGQGWGSKLLGIAEREGFTKSPLMHLWVTEDNERAQRFYAQHGWLMDAETSQFGSLRWLRMTKTR